MEIVSQLFGMLMLIGFKLKHKDDGQKTERGLWVFSCIYVICATSLILAPVVLGRI